MVSVCAIQALIPVLSTVELRTGEHLHAFQFYRKNLSIAHDPRNWAKIRANKTGDKQANTVKNSSTKINGRKYSRWLINFVYAIINGPSA
jgi:hypothetical protein